MTDMYGRSALREIAALPLPHQRDDASYEPEAAAWLEDVLFCAFTLYGDSTRPLLLGFRDGEVSRHIELPAPVIDLAVHRGRLIMLGLDLEISWLDGETIRPLGPSSALPPVPPGPHAASVLRSEATFCFDTAGPDLVAYYLWCGETRVFSRYQETAGWTSLPPPELIGSASLCMHDGAPLVSGCQTEGHKTSYVLLSFSEGTWKTRKPRAHFALMKSAAKLHTGVRVRNDELGRVLGLMAPDAIVRLGAKDVFEWPVEKWQLPTSTVEIVRSTRWSFFFVELRAGKPMLVERCAEQAFAPPETEPRSTKPPKLVFPPTRFFDGTLVARDCFLSDVRFLDDDCLLAIGSTKQEIVVHELRRRDDAWMHVRRHSLPAAFPHEIDAYGTHADYQYTFATASTGVVVGVCTTQRHQWFRFDALRGVCEDLDLGGEGYLCGVVDETFVVSAPLRARGPAVFVCAGAAEVRSAQSFAGGTLVPFGPHV